MKPSYEEILSIQRNVDIVDIIKDYINLTPRGKNFFGICPFHDDHSPSMSVSKDRQMYRCFVCGASGNVFNFVKNYENISYYSAIKKVADKVGLSFSYKEKETTINPIQKKYYDIYNYASKYYQNNLKTSLGKTAKIYLKNRNITDDMIKHFNIGLSLNDNNLTKLLLEKGFIENELVEFGISNRIDNKTYDIYKNRIMFPLWDINGNTIGFSGRIYDSNQDGKYINTKETNYFKKGSLLYNYHNARKEILKENSVIVVEGFMDVIRLYSINVYNVIATMGTAVTKEHLNLIKRLTNNIILMFDGDSAGEKATNSFIKEAENESFKISIVRLEEDLDPDDYILKKGKEKIKYHLKHPKNLLNYKMDFLKKDLNFDNSKDISKYINLLKPELEKIEDDIEREVEINRISKQTGVDSKLIKSKLKTKVKQEKKEFIKDKIDYKTNKYEKASKMILYFMLKNNDLIDYYYENLSFLPNKDDNLLANQMVLFYKKYNCFNLNDFITYLEDKSNLINEILQIESYNYKINCNKEEIDSYFKSVKEYIKNKKIEELQIKLKNETNDIVKKEIAKQILDIRIKGV